LKVRVLERSGGKKQEQRTKVQAREFSNGCGREEKHSKETH